MIAERKVNTLILVDKISLLSQWRDKLLEFLIINEVLPETNNQNKKRGRKKKTSIIGQLGGGKNNLGGIVDVAVMQSISRQGDVKDCVRDYEMIIADECHHASAFTYENIFKTTTAKYIYGLTATPTRKDGRHPILTMHLGPIRYRDNAIKQAEKRPFEHYIIPRFTSFKAPLNQDENEITIFHVKMLEKMYQKRLKGYASMGYKVKGEMPSASLEIIFNQDNFLPVFCHDASMANKEILIVSPFVRKRRSAQMIKNLNLVLGEQINIIVVTRPVSDFKQKDQGAIQSALDFLNDKNVSVVYLSNIHQKFAVMDRKIVWYGSINLLSYGSALESIMRIESSNIAHELMKSIETRKIERGMA